MPQTPQQMNNQGPIGAGVPLGIPGGAPMGAPAAPMGGGSPLDNLGPPPMSEAEMASDLDARFEEVERKKAELDTRKITDKNRLEQAKGEILGKFFEVLTKMGVDLNDPSSIGKFITELEKEDPDFVVLLTKAFETLGTEPGKEDPREMANRFGGLQEDILRGVMAEEQIVPRDGMEGLESLEGTQFPEDEITLPDETDPGIPPIEEVMPPLTQ